MGGGEVVLQVDGAIVDDFAAIAAHEQALAAKPRKVLFAGEIENAEAVAEIEGGNELVGVGQLFGLGRTLSGGALHDGRGEAAGGDGGGLAADAEEAADEAYAVIAVAGRKLDLADASKTAAVGEGEAGGVVGLAMVLFGDLDAGALLLQSPECPHFVNCVGGRRFGEYGHIVCHQITDDMGVGRPGDAGYDEVRGLGCDHFGGGAVEMHAIGGGQVDGQMRAARGQTCYLKLSCKGAGGAQEPGHPPSGADDAKTDHYSFSGCDDRTGLLCGCGRGGRRRPLRPPPRPL